MTESKFEKLYEDYTEWLAAQCKKLITNQQCNTRYCLARGKGLGSTCIPYEIYNILRSDVNG